MRTLEELMKDQSGRDYQPINVRGEMTKRRSATGKLMDSCGAWLARPVFFAGLLAFHLAWVLLNLVPGLPAWDPPPFPLLAAIASAEAPFLSLMILMRQNRDERIAELRQEVLLHVALQVHNQTAKLTTEEPLQAEALIELVRHELECDEGPMDGENEE